MRARSEWTGLLAIVAALTLVGCEAGRSPVTPEPEISNTAAARAEGGADPMQVVIERGSLDITGRYDNKLNIGTSDPARFSWKGELTEGNNPIARVTIGVPGEAALIEGSWSGGELSNTLVTWGKKQTFAQAGGNLSPSAGVFHVLGTVMLPLYSGQPSAKVTTPFALDGNTHLTVYDPSPLQLWFTGSGTATVFLMWVPVWLNDAHPDGYWQFSRIVYRFAKQG